jgi:hypothetical protein
MSGRFEEEKNFLPLSSIQPRFYGLPACNPDINKSDNFIGLKGLCGRSPTEGLHNTRCWPDQNLSAKRTTYDFPRSDRSKSVITS